MNDDNWNTNIHILYFLNNIIKYELALKAVNEDVKKIIKSNENKQDNNNELIVLNNLINDENNILKIGFLIDKVFERKKDSINSFIINCFSEHFKKSIGSEVLKLWITIIIFFLMAIAFFVYKINF